MCVRVLGHRGLVKWNYVYRWKGQAHWPAQTGRQLVWAKNAGKNRKVTSFSAIKKSSKSPQRDRNRQRRKKAVRSRPELSLTDEWTAGKSGDTTSHHPLLVICRPFYDQNTSVWGEIRERKIVLITIPQIPDSSVMHAHSWITGIFVLWFPDN